MVVASFVVGTLEGLGGDTVGIGVGCVGVVEEGVVVVPVPDGPDRSLVGICLVRSGSGRGVLPVGSAPASRGTRSIASQLVLSASTRCRTNKARTAMPATTMIANQRGPIRMLRMENQLL